MSYNLARLWSHAVITKQAVDGGADLSKLQESLRVFYNKSGAIYHPCHKDLMGSMDLHSTLIDPNLLQQYEQEFAQWLQSHSTNQIPGLDQYDADIMQGSTQAIDHWHTHHKEKRVVCMKGEYPYHAIVRKNLGCAYIEIESPEQIQNNDAVIISLPFYDTGNVHELLDEILDQCHKKNVPVLLDCVWYPIAESITVPADHPAVDCVAFSLSKTFPVAYGRCGIRFTKKHYNDGGKVHSFVNYNNRLTAAVGLKFIRTYSPDWITQRFSALRDKICQHLDLTKTSCVSICQGNSSWQAYTDNYKHELRKTYDLNASVFQSSACKLGIQTLLEYDSYVEQMFDLDEQAIKQLITENIRQKINADF